ncbi:MAG: hypothetical protein PHQ35_09210 [Phycisphaerae bacterium]|nr:hypothetical protein [Phycisphaerae bacterium]MDD5381818.1 hypothetical protein [Phycisphaerae bacterium]
MSDWEIDKPLGQCSGSGNKIGYEEEYFAALVETGEGLSRRDFCADYWQAAKPNVFCYWKTRLPRPDEKKHKFIDDEMLMAFFERLGKETEQERINFRFVLALVLMRKRRLKYDSSKIEGGKEVWRLRIAGEKEYVEVTNPNLDDEQIKQLTSQIGEILQTDL